MPDRPEAIDRALDALGEALSKTASRLSDHPVAAPWAEKVASVLGTSVDALAASTTQGRVATETAFQAISTFLSDAASGDPAQREAATAKLDALRARVQAAGVPLDDLGQRVSAWAQQTAAMEPSEVPRGMERLRDLMGSLRASLDTMTAAPAEAAAEPPADPASDAP